MLQGKRMKILRAQLGMSQAKLAKALGVTTTTVSGWEVGRYMVSVKAAKKLIQLAAENNINLTMDELYSE